MNRGVLNLLARRCSESKSLVQGAELSIFIAVIPGGHYKARTSTGHMCGHWMKSVALSSKVSLHFK